MKNPALSLLLLAIFFSASAQDAKNNPAFKGYISFKASQNGAWIRNGNFGYGYFHAGDPGFAVAFIRTKGNYHQVELSDLALDRYENTGGYQQGRITDVTFGFRYGYYINLLKSKNGRFKASIAPGVHLVVQDRIFNPVTTSEFAARYATYTGEVEVTPVIMYQITRHFSIEANLPVTIIGLSEEFTHRLDQGLSSADQRFWEDELFPGPQYFHGRIGAAFNL